MNKTHIAGLLLVSFWFIAWKTSAEPVESQSVISPEDRKKYIAMFERFYELGLPNPKGGKYVRLKARSYTFNSFENTPDHPTASFEFYGLEGNAWLMKKNSDGTSRFIANLAEEVDVYPYDLLQKKWNEKKKVFQKLGCDPRTLKEHEAVFYNSHILGKWRCADLKNDIVSLIAYIKKHPPCDQIHNLYGYYLFSAQIYRLGFSKEAFVICNKLKYEKSHISFINNSLLIWQYMEIFRDFLKSQNWYQFRQTITIKPFWAKNGMIYVRK